MRCRYKKSEIENLLVEDEILIIGRKITEKHQLAL